MSFGFALTALQKPFHRFYCRQRFVIINHQRLIDALVDPLLFIVHLCLPAISKLVVGGRILKCVCTIIVLRNDPSSFPVHGFIRDYHHKFVGSTCFAILFQSSFFLSQRVGSRYIVGSLVSSFTVTVIQELSDIANRIFGHSNFL